MTLKIYKKTDVKQAFEELEDQALDEIRKLVTKIRALKFLRGVVDQSERMGHQDPTFKIIKNYIQPYIEYITLEEIGRELKKIEEERI